MFIFLSSTLPSLPLSPTSESDPGREPTKENKDGVKPELAGIPIQQKRSEHPVKKDDFLKRFQDRCRIERYSRREIFLPVK